MTTVVPDLAPDEWRVKRPRIVHIGQLGVCDLDGCTAPGLVTVTWTPREDFGSRTRCLGDFRSALELALDDSFEDSQITVEYLVPRPAAATFHAA